MLPMTTEFPFDYVIGIDPGPNQSGLAQMDYGPRMIESFGMYNNTTIIEDLLLRFNVNRIDRLFAFEWFECYGRPVGSSVFDAVLFIGRAIQYIDCMATIIDNARVILIPKRIVSLHLCNTTRVKDTNIKQALIDRFGPTRKEALGTKKYPGPLYGIHTHIWDALAVAVTIDEMKREGGKEWKELIQRSNSILQV